MSSSFSEPSGDKESESMIHVRNDVVVVMVGLRSREMSAYIYNILPRLSSISTGGSCSCLDEQWFRTARAAAGLQVG